MKKQIIMVVCLLLSVSLTFAQMTLIQSSNNSNNVWAVNLKLSGKKYVIFDEAAAQVRLYNPDHSLWKNINLPPTVSGMSRANYQVPSYISENLFKIDNKVDLAVSYVNSSTGEYSLVILDETGAVVSIADSVREISVHNIGITTDSFVACIQGYNNGKAKIYSLPGTIPCGSCNNSLGIAKVDPKSVLSDPVPNPSSSQVRLTFELPEDAKEGQINLYTDAGKLIKTYTVDKTFGYIILNNSELPSGLYYYNLTSNGTISSIKKMVVLK